MDARLPIALWLSISASLVTGAAEAQRGPVIQRIEPTAGPPGTRLHVIGRNLGAVDTVAIGDTALEIEGRLPSRLTVRVVDGVVPGPVTVRGPGGEARGPHFRPIAALVAPRVRGIVPASGRAGSHVELHGAHFSPRLGHTRVTIGGVDAMVYSATPQRLVVVVPEGARSGFFEVEVEHAGVARSGPFEVLPADGPGSPGAGSASAVPPPLAPEEDGAAAAAPPAATSPTETAPPPTVTGFRPAAGPAGSTLVVDGRGFSSEPVRNVVRIGEVPLEVLQARPHRLKVRVARAPSGLLSVERPGVGRGVSRQPFVVTVPPHIASVQPLQAPVGADVTIRGRGFGDRPGGVRVAIGGRRLHVRTVSDDRIVARIPRGARSGELEVSVPLEGRATAARPFVVLGVPAPGPSAGGG